MEMMSLLKQENGIGRGTAAPGEPSDLRKLEPKDVGTSAEGRRQIRKCELPEFQPLLRGHEERPERPKHGNLRGVDRDSGASPAARRKKDHVPCATLMFVGRHGSWNTFLLSRRMAGACRRNGSRGGHRKRRAAQLTEAHDGRQRRHQDRKEQGLTSSTHRDWRIHRRSARAGHQGMKARYPVRVVEAG